MAIWRTKGEDLYYCHTSEDILESTFILMIRFLMHLTKLPRTYWLSLNRIQHVLLVHNGRCPLNRQTPCDLSRGRVWIPVRYGHVGYRRCVFVLPLLAAANDWITLGGLRAFLRIHVPALSECLRWLPLLSLICTLGGVPSSTCVSVLSCCLVLGGQHLPSSSSCSFLHVVC